MNQILFLDNPNGVVQLNKPNQTKLSMKHLPV